MSLENGKHYPAKPDKFEFDAEVAATFPDMARRSIPLYEEMHALHAHLLCADAVDKYPLKPYRVLDIGSSRCEFILKIRGTAHQTLWNGMEIIASDKSRDMITETMKWPGHEQITYRQFDLGDPGDDQFKDKKFDAVSIHYVMQFIPLGARPFAFYQLGRLVKPGGLLLYGEKNVIDPNPDGSSTPYDVHYIQFRLKNGYSPSEISAKTAALKNSMWPVAREETERLLRDHAGFEKIEISTCNGLFRSFTARKA